MLDSAALCSSKMRACQPRGKTDESVPNRRRPAPATSSAFNDLVLRAALPIDLGHGLSLTPYLTYVALVDSDIRKTNAFDKDDDYLFGGISLAAEF